MRRFEWAMVSNAPPKNGGVEWAIVGSEWDHLSSLSLIYSVFVGYYIVYAVLDTLNVIRV
jgi:hypothetical protein